MMWRASVFLATLGILSAQQQLPPKPPPDDDVTAYLNERRAHALHRMAMDELLQSADMSLSQGHFNEAEAIYRKVMAELPEDSRPIEGVAHVYLAQDRTGDAMRFLQAEVAQNPGLRAFRSALVEIAGEWKQDDVALAALKDTPEDQISGNTYRRLADLFRLKNNLDGSIAALRKAKELLPGHTEVDIALAQDLTASGQKEAAAKVYKAVLGVDPSDGPALMQRFAVLMDGPQPDMNVLMACAELAGNPMSDNPAALDALGWMYVMTNRPHLAIPIYENLVSKAPQVATYHYHFGMAHFREGKEAEMRKEFETALQYNPGEQVKRDIEQTLAQQERRRTAPAKK